MSSADVDLHQASEPSGIVREVPQSFESEQAILSCILMQPRESLSECVSCLTDSANTFYHIPHQVIYEMAVAMESARERIDIVSLQQRLKDNQQLEAIGGIEYLIELRDKIPTTDNLSIYLEIIIEKHTLRKLINTCTATIADAYEHSGPIDPLVDKFEADALRIRKSIDANEQSESKSLVHEVLNDFDAMHQNQGKLSGLASGFADLDKMTWGFQRQQMIVIAARPSVGKTALAMNIADYIAVELKEPVGVFSLEMSKLALMRRQICARARVNVQHIRDGFSERDFPKLTSAAGALANAPLIINDRGGLNILQVRAKARRMIQQYGIKLFVIDYLQLLHGYSKKAEMNRPYEVQEVSNGIKEMAKELDVPIIVLAQLNRDLEKRKTNTPVMADLKESGAIEQDADILGLLYKPKDDDDDDVVANDATLLIAKQRDGPTGPVHLTFLKEFTRFESQAKITADED